MYVGKELPFFFSFFFFALAHPLTRCRDFADEYPSAEVIGSDLSPIQPTFVPPNLKFEVDDVEEPWVYPENHFDLIHVRALYGAVADWPEFYRNALR